MRAVVVAPVGAVNVYDPEFETFAAMVVAYVLPPSRENSIVTLRLNPPVLVQVTVVDPPAVTTAGTDTLVIVSGMPSAVVSLNQPTSRICCLVRSRVSGRPTVMFGYMLTMAYVAALIVYQVASALGAG